MQRVRRFLIAQGWESGAIADAVSRVLSPPTQLFASSWTRLFLICATVAAPTIYCLFAISIGAVTFPFYDHVGTARYIIASFDGTLTAGALFDPHNEHRPVVMRVLQIGLARLTGWNISAEYAITFSSLAATFALLAAAAMANVRERTRFPALALLTISLFIFSPAGHNNMWWSFMFQLTFAAMFSYAAFALMSDTRPRWWNAVCASIVCWLSLLSMANGFATFAVCFVVAALHFVAAEDQRLKRGALTLFWVLNLCAAFYVATMDAAADRTLPSLFRVVGFLVVYIGAPLEGLVSHPYASMWDFPRPFVLGAVFGVFGSIAAIWALALSWRRVQRGHAMAMFPIACIGFAVATGVLIAIGRAGGEGGVSAALSSRYTIFAAFLYVGVIFAASARETEHRTARTASRTHLAVVSVLVAVFLASATAAYARGLTIFRQAGAFNNELVNAYSLHPSASAHYASVYPDVSRVAPLKQDLLRLRIGPYRALASEEIAFDPGASTLDPTALNGNGWVRQRIEAAPENVCGLRYQIVTWGQRLTEGSIAWRVLGADASAPILAQGSIDLAGRSDWETFELPVLDANAPFIVEFRSAAPTSALYGLPTRTSEAATWSNPAEATSDAAQPTRSRALPFSFRVCY